MPNATLGCYLTHGHIRSRPAAPPWRRWWALEPRGPVEVRFNMTMTSSGEGTGDAFRVPSRRAPKPARPRAPRPAPPAAAFVSHECELLHTSLLIPPVKVRGTTRRRKMALKQPRFEIMFGMVLAIVVTILGITTWTRHNWATPIPPAIYRSQLLNVY
jgi:hypothetical protein